MHEFDTLPEEAQKDITNHVRYRLETYRGRLSAHNRAMPRQDLMLHLEPQICNRGERAPDGTGPWPEEMTQYFCASKDLLEWCHKYFKLYQTTEKVFPLSSGNELHVSLSCYRTRMWNRYLDDINIPICIITCIMVSCVFHAWYIDWKKYRGEFGEDGENQGRPSPSPSPPPPPSKKKATGNPAAPLPKLRSRHENFRNRRS
ncbi:hypothetical protein GCK72_006271 [Caenorhabditis remanei]|uniref:Uncharacterized protein n=1 Tax=Caenorhabditis remanei TaxID=31234 RepID=A0A6A5HFU4_CAERE|nr:hypothetical protein GCK72_006271 [Caenorhabditis remanei]KAF1766315.1 hypothetical protein GCK72_006271 [Caenorhabditis remanei]